MSQVKFCKGHVESWFIKGDPFTMLTIFSSTNLHFVLQNILRCSFPIQKILVKEIIMHWNSSSKISVIFNSTFSTTWWTNIFKHSRKARKFNEAFKESISGNMFSITMHKFFFSEKSSLVVADLLYYFSTYNISIDSWNLKNYNNTNLNL